MPAKIVVVGSYNIDMTIKAARIPQLGETIIGGSFSMGAGGKGANQAVAAARAGAEVWFVARVGDDTFGDEALQHLHRDGINTDFVIRDKTAPTGVASIVVDDDGENSIVVASGANSRLQPCDVEAAKDVIAAADTVLLQLESPLETVAAAAEMAAACDVGVVLNPAPAQTLTPELLKFLSIITPNEVEAEMLTGIKIVDEKSWTAAAQALRACGVATAMITLGSQGVFVATAHQRFLVPAFKVEAVDTTAAGDVFNGALAAFLSRDRTIAEAVSLACAAAALSVSKLGAQASAPLLHEIENFLHHAPSATAGGQSKKAVMIVTVKPL